MMTHDDRSLSWPGTPLSIDAGCVLAARQVASPNYNERPADTVIDMLVVHNISLPPGNYGGGHVDELFCNRLQPQVHPYFELIHHLQVSAHLFIDRRGALTQFVNLHHRAWHAGASCFDGRENCNDFSIGIELEGSDTEPFTEVQYDCLGHLARAVCCAFPAITLPRIVGHSDIAPGRKTDPGPFFDWPRLRNILSCESLGSQP